MTFMGIGVVFVILVLLVFILQIFSATAKQTTKAVVKGVDKVEDVAKKVTPGPSEEEKNAVAVAVALYLNMKDTHDYESGVLTINQGTSNWHSVLNTRL